MPIEISPNEALRVFGFASRISAKIEFTSTCWIWTGSVGKAYTKRSGGGYGQIRSGGKTKKIHRVVYELLIGPIPEGLQLDHICGNKKCVNPLHLEPVSGLTNSLRYTSKQTHCKHGHLYDLENTLWRPNSRSGNLRRICKACYIKRAKGL